MKVFWFMGTMTMTSKIIKHLGMKENCMFHGFD